MDLQLSVNRLEDRREILIQARVRTVERLERVDWFTQEIIVRKLRLEGYSNLSIRTLTYWRGEGLLPPLIRQGNVYFYSEAILDRIRLLCISSPRQETRPSTLLSYEIEGDSFDIQRVEIVRIGGEVRAFFYEKSGGVLTKEIGEEILHAIA